MNEENKVGPEEVSVRAAEIAAEMRAIRAAADAVVEEKGASEPYDGLRLLALILLLPAKVFLEAWVLKLLWALVAPTMGCPVPSMRFFLAISMGVVAVRLMVHPHVEDKEKLSKTLRAAIVIVGVLWALALMALAVGAWA